MGSQSVGFWAAEKTLTKISSGSMCGTAISINSRPPSPVVTMAFMDPGSILFDSETYDYE